MNLIKIYLNVSIIFYFRGGSRRTLSTLRASSARCGPGAPLPAGWSGVLPHRETRQCRSRGHPARSHTAQTPALRAGLRQAQARQDGVHVRATGGFGEQVSHDAVPVSMWKTEPGPVSESDRNAGENLVPEQEDQMEKAESRGGQHPAARVQFTERQSKPVRVRVKPRHLPPNLSQLRLWECDLPHDRKRSPSIHWRAPALVHTQWFCSADLL